MLESAGTPLSKSCEINNKNFDALYPDSEKSQILSILTPLHPSLGHEKLILCFTDAADQYFGKHRKNKNHVISKR